LVDEALADLGDVHLAMLLGGGVRDMCVQPAGMRGRAIERQSEGVDAIVVEI
jgi:hypothetical protein